VAALLTKSKMPERLRTIITGESLFNDGIGIVLFISFSEIASIPDKTFAWGALGQLFAQEVFGGLILGLILGWFAYCMMRSIEDFQTIVLISFTLVMCISVVGSLIHVSIPLAVVAAGLLVGSHPFRKKTASVALSDYLEKIWKLTDDVLNTILFVLIGLQMVAVTFSLDYLWVGLIAIVSMLLARAASIVLPIVFLRRTLNVQYNSVVILTWGGLRGGISVALALSLPPSPYRELILTASFIIVIFSVVIQGLTLNKVVDKVIS
jgi:CPA1 family monovalent cation:H+ antiporter